MEARGKCRGKPCSGVSMRARIGWKPGHKTGSAWTVRCRRWISPDPPEPGSRRLSGLFGFLVFPLLQQGHPGPAVAGRTARGDVIAGTIQRENAPGSPLAVGTLEGRGELDEEEGPEQEENPSHQHGHDESGGAGVRRLLLPAPREPGRKAHGRSKRIETIFSLDGGRARNTAPGRRDLPRDGALDREHFHLSSPVHPIPLYCRSVWIPGIRR